MKAIFAALVLGIVAGKAMAQTLSDPMRPPNAAAAESLIFGGVSAKAEGLTNSTEYAFRLLATYAGGYAIWLLYGLSVESIPLILGDAVGLVCGVVTLAVALELRGSLLRPTSWGHRDDTSAPLPDDQQPRSFNREPPLGPVLEL